MFKKLFNNYDYESLIATSYLTFIFGLILTLLLATIMSIIIVPIRTWEYQIQAGDWVVVLDVDDVRYKDDEELYYYEQWFEYGEHEHTIKGQGYTKIEDMRYKLAELVWNETGDEKSAYDILHAL